ncbi:tetratricopeptide repeat protein [Streptomyces sp. NPDC052682]|uniref:tetratricopeptide repeat protein n=1 Tax=Streptomyces sp. NPDC052682 TaxID=3154954 RepID=UPI0034123DA3
MHVLGPGRATPEDDLVGRTGETTMLLELLAPDATAPGCLLHGPGGVGKTALARAVARLAVARPGWFTGGALLLQARDSCGEGRMTTGQAASALVRAMRLLHDGTELTEQEKSAVLRRWLTRQSAAGRQVLLILDDVEEVASAERLLPPGTGRLLVTTRGRPAAVGSLTAVELTALSPPRTEELITAVAARNGLTVPGPKDVAALARLCDGIPLAAELAAGAAALDSRAAPHAAARSRVRAAVDAQGRAHAAVRASVDLVLSCLPESDLRMAVRMARHPGPDHGSLQLTAWGGTLTALPARVPQFVRAGLIKPAKGADGEIRYVMHPLIRHCLLQHDEPGNDGFQALAVSRLLDTYERDAALLAMCRENQASQRQAGPAGTEDANLPLTKDRENLVAVLVGAADPTDRRTLAAARCVLQHLAHEDRPYETLALADRCVTVARTLGDRDALAWALLGCGEILGRLGRFAEADAAFAQAVAVYERLIRCPPEERRTDAHGRAYREMRDPLAYRYSLATAYDRRAAVQCAAHLHTQAAAAHEAASAIYVEDGQWYDLMTRGPVRAEYQVPWAASLYHQGVALARAHRFLEACSALRQAATLQRDLGAPGNEAVALTVLWKTAHRASVLAASGVEHVRAELHGVEALAAAADQQGGRAEVEATLRDIVEEREGPCAHPVEALALWGTSLVERGRAEEGVRVLGDAATRCRRDGRLFLLAEILQDVGDALVRTRRTTEAVDAHREAVAVWEELADRRGRALAGVGLATALVAAGRREEAVTFLCEAEHELAPSASDVGPRVLQSIAYLRAATRRPAATGLWHQGLRRLWRRPR